jgi:hypothetical protein
MHLDATSLPDAVKIREVGPRDGFQNEPEVIATEDKIRLIDLLSATGLKRIEVTSFVRPDVIPQLSDADEVLDGITRRQGVAFSVLIPNRRGLDRALERRDRFDPRRQGRGDTLRRHRRGLLRLSVRRQGRAPAGFRDRRKAA